jgi:hypothetical protein
MMRQCEIKDCTCEESREKWFHKVVLSGTRVIRSGFRIKLRVCSFHARIDEVF